MSRSRTPTAPRQHAHKSRPWAALAIPSFMSIPGVPQRLYRVLPQQEPKEAQYELSMYLRLWQVSSSPGWRSDSGCRLVRGRGVPVQGQCLASLHVHAGTTA